MNPESDSNTKRIVTGLASAGGRLIRIGAIALLLYVVFMLVFAISNYSGTKSSLISHGASNATASLIAWAVMLIAAGLPTLALVRIFNWRGRPIDYAAAMILPLISWGIAQFPANFDQTGAALKYCSNRPDGTLFCLDHAGVDPITQTKLTPMSASLAEVEFRRNKGLVPKRIALPPAEIVFFDALTGQPKVWVHENDQGCFDIFDNPGVDPQSGEPLSQITKKVVRAIKECANGSLPNASNNGATNLLEPSRAQQTGAAVGQVDCKVFPILNMNAMTVETPYAGGCKHGMAEGQGSFTYRVHERVHSVKGEFHAGKLNGNATITQPDRAIEGEFRDNLLWNTITRGVLPGGIRFAAQIRDGAIFAMCRADKQEERNCTDREQLVETSYPPPDASQRDHRN
jgi:hypothetical protein